MYQQFLGTCICVVSNKINADLNIHDFSYIFVFKYLRQKEAQITKYYLTFVLLTS